MCILLLHVQYILVDQYVCLLIHYSYPVVIYLSVNKIVKTTLHIAINHRRLMVVIFYFVWHKEFVTWNANNIRFGLCQAIVHCSHQKPVQTRARMTGKWKATSLHDCYRWKIQQHISMYKTNELLKMRNPLLILAFVPNPNGCVFFINSPCLIKLAAIARAFHHFCIPALRILEW